MKIANLKIKGPKLIKTNIYNDNRGFLKEVYQNRLLEKSFVFSLMSFSKKNVLRGLHIQTTKPQAKIITVIQGKILDIAVDLRKNSKTFGKHHSVIISQNSDFSFYIPEGFAHGFLCLSDECIVNYACSNYRNKASEKTLSWNDKKIGINWPISKPILSNKDKEGKDLDFFM